MCFRTKPGEFVLQLMGLPVDATPRTVSEFLYPTSLKESEISIVKSSDGSGRCIGTGFARVIYHNILLYRVLVIPFATV